MWLSIIRSAAVQWRWKVQFSAHRWTALWRSVTWNQSSRLSWPTYLTILGRELMRPRNRMFCSEAQFSVLAFFPMNDKLSTCVLGTSNLTLQETILLFFSLNELLIKTRLNSLLKTNFLTGQNLIIWQQNFNRFYQLHLIIPLQLILKISLGSISIPSLSPKSLSSSCFHPQLASN